MINPKNIISKLTTLIEKHKTYIIDGSLNRNQLAADARKYDPELLNLLQKDNELKKHFFSATDGGLVFKKDIFLQFIMNKDFLPDSYTKYKIKIGLGAEDGSLLSENVDVVLNWPYKDAILEGGQDKEDQKRSEVFFNEVLAPDQITRLLDDKIFTNWKRYDEDGEHELDDLNDDDNLIIKGNNLVVLNSLLKRYAGKVKLIYIDPPYNTGSDSFGYNDRFNHSTWLTFMSNRLKVAKKLLRNDGVIFIHCDYNEQAYLKVLMDDPTLFGDNYISMITLKTSSESGVKVNAGKPVKVSEYLLMYAKDKSQYRYNKVYVPSGYDKNYSKYVANPNEEYSRWKISSLSDIASSHLKIKKSMLNDQILEQFQLDNRDNIFSVRDISSSFKSYIKTNYINPDQVTEYTTSTGKKTLLYKNGEVVFVSRKIKEIDGKEYLTKIASDQWIDIAWDGIASEGGITLKAGKKPEKLIKRILETSTVPGDIVLDYHLGSGTTAAVAHKMERQYIGIEQLYYGDNDPIVRLNNVISGDQSGISKSVNWKGGGNFVYANIMNNSNKFRKRVEMANNQTDYIQLFKEATSSSFLSYRVDPKKLNEDEFKKLSSTEKRRLLLELIDKNTLYVNYEDINDPIFKVSEKDKYFNKKLYEKK